MSGFSETLSVFKGKRVLITGDTGFKGSWLTLWLDRLGAELTGFSLPPAGERPLFEAAGLSSVIDHIDGDIRNLDALQAAFDKAKPEMVFHLAAQSLVRPSYDDPKLTFDTNVGGGVNLLEAVRKTDSVQALVFITSDKCYYPREWAWGYREIDSLGGLDPYSASKAGAEVVLIAYQESFYKERAGFGSVSARAGNVIGGGDWAEDRIIPDCMRALSAGQAIRLRNPNATRPWQHVLEPLSGYLLLAARILKDPDTYADPWNFGPTTEAVMTVGDLADRVVELWGNGEVVIEAEAEAPHEVNLLQLNTDKAQIKLGWKPHWNVHQSVSETVAWYKAVHEGQTEVDVTRRQIDAYMEER